MRNLNRKFSIVIFLSLLVSTLCWAENDTRLVPPVPVPNRTEAPKITISQPGESVAVPSGFDENKQAAENANPDKSSAIDHPHEASEPKEPAPVFPQKQKEPEQSHFVSPDNSNSYSFLGNEPDKHDPPTEQTTADKKTNYVGRSGNSAETLIERLKSFKNTPQIVEDEDYQAVEVSLKDVTRIVCFTNITRTVYSKEKGIEIKTVDKNAFIKNLPKEIIEPSSGRIAIEYDSRPKEVYIVCGDKTFSLLLIPKDIPANTIYLKSSYVDKEKAFSFEKSGDYENMILKLIRSAYLEDILEGYDVEDIGKVVREYQEVRMVHKRNYTGIMFQVQEYVLIARKELNINEITLLEAVSPRNPLAVSIVSPVMRPNEQSRFFIVRLLKDE